MRCRLCQEDKLSREFPRETVTDECEHPPFYCLRCVTNKVKSSWQCPYDKCGKPVSRYSERLKEFEMRLDFLFPTLEPAAADPQTEPDSSAGGQQTVHVTTLTGDTESFTFLQSLTVVDLKQMIRDRMNVEINKQRLVFNEKELESYSSDGSPRKLSEYGVKPYCTVHLMVLLYAIPDTFNHVIFELSWRYPQHGRDFLDASCLMFMGDVYYDYVDWMFPESESYNVWHSGDQMNDIRRTGRHKIEAKLRNIPKCVSHLVFVLSSFKASSIGHFPEPTLRFYDAADDSQDLVSQTYTSSITSQALILCCVSRTKDNRWMLYKGGQQSAGNAKYYSEIVNTVKRLIRSSVFPGVSLERGTSRLSSNWTAEQQRRFLAKCANR